MTIQVRIEFFINASKKYRNWWHGNQKQNSSSSHMRPKLRFSDSDTCKAGSLIP